MFLNAKKLAFLGLLLAFDVILVVFSGILEINTLFLLAAASFCVGIAIREEGKSIGFGFYLASILLGLILAPNKFYCITYAAMGMYLVLIEYAFDKLVQIKNSNKRKILFWIMKYLVYNVMFLPILFLLPKLIYQGELSTWLLALLLVVGQVALFVYDQAYNYFQRSVWGKVRGRFKLR